MTFSTPVSKELFFVGMFPCRFCDAPRAALPFTANMLCPKHPSTDTMNRRIS